MQNLPISELVEVHIALTKLQTLIRVAGKPDLLKSIADEARQEMWK
ncbi:hypothetical protein [Armatimonas rosea]|uniref:Uncharacterized protein n=1 Tax=Armatimonas rosea TaxID=685828 RepID=A0A7W9W6P3_ARMRO|nr:hypothetical protein [Armatimonas rosea]MBB6051649.1 hypothetical protein [Armatimonas rosea]